MEQPSSGQSSSQDDSNSQSQIAESIYLQGIKRVLGIKELLLDTARTLKTQQNQLQEAKRRIDEQQKHELYLGNKDVHLPYCFKVDDSRSWIKDVFIQEMMSDEDSDRDVTEEEYRDMLRQHRWQKKCKEKLKLNTALSRFTYYSSDFITGDNKWPSHRKGYRAASKKRKLKQELKVKSEGDMIAPFPSAFPSENTRKDGNDDDNLQDATSLAQTAQFSSLNTRTVTNTGTNPSHPLKKKKTISVDTIRKRLWKFIAKKEIPKAFRIRSQIRGNNVALVKRVSRECMKKQKVLASASTKISKDKAGRARRITREMQMFWKKYSKVEKVHRKKAEKHALERIKMDEEIREAKRQQRKLNFLISQTELFAHFISKKLSKQQDGSDIDERIKSILNNLETSYKSDHITTDEDQFPDKDTEEHDGSYYSDKAMKNVKRALEVQKRQTTSFDPRKSDLGLSHNPLNPSDLPSDELKQPSLFNGALKSYQLKGMNWLVNLYEQGINGILADEMGLGKTVQTIAFLGHLAEKVGIWGPFLVVAPASTLNNWHQEFTRFFPAFKVLPYWGNAAGRKVLRKFWNQKVSHHSNKESAPFHVLVTSYQLVISDVRYFQRIKWQYMILDEAQALKSSTSIRWKILLEFNCRNRLLLTGTPIQNTMAELWALLHFIMPSLFDSHDEFNEWFSKDIENHIENKSNIDEKQLSRLHMILKPFMLRRIKMDVENELSEKIEIRVHCSLTPRQKILYHAIQKNIKLEDLLRLSGTTSVSSNNSTTLMNLVMQFRKVCNHPDLFERREVMSSFSSEPLPTYLLPRLLYRQGILSRVNHFKRKLLYCDLSIHQPAFVLSIDNPNHVSISYSLLRALNIDFAEYWHELRTNPICCIKLNEKIRDTIFSLYFRYIFNSNSAQSCNRPTDIVTSPHKQTGVSTKRIFNKTNVKLSDILIVPTNFYSAFSPSGLFQNLLFTQNCENFYTHDDTITCLQTRHNDSYPHQNSTRAVSQLVPVTLPSCFSTMYLPPVIAKIGEIYCCDRSACNEIHLTLLEQRWSSQYMPNSSIGLSSIMAVSAQNMIRLPDRECLVRDSGKLYALDILLRRLKKEGHRVLIYSQMTRMIDLLEEYMWYRSHTYMRLDGSSKISERRDMVADFQSRSDIFAFLLSTRAGGLGINLTAADTVIFYDSDWNPTVDQQAMDRAHRLGQTKQVTVYRLVCQGTVDERILQRAEEKSVIQRMVIAGGNFHPDTLKAKEVVSLLLDDEQLAQRLKMKKEENKVEGAYKGKKRGRKTNAEREAKRLKELQEQGITEEHVTIIHSASSTPPSVGRSSLDDKIKPSKMSSSLDLDFDSLHYFDSAPASPVSEVSVNSDLKNLDDDLIVVDDNVTPVPSPSIRGKGVKRARGRPRIRPIMPEVPKRSYNRSSTNRGRPRGRGLRRGRKIITGRAAAMAGARAGAAAASAAAYAAYGYGMESSSLTVLKNDKTVSNLNSNT